MDVRVLIVEDDPTEREPLAKSLRRPGVRIDAAPDGAAAVSEVERTDYDVVLLDARMPDPDGLETFNQIRQVRPLTEVIFLTGHACIDTAVECMKRGAFDYLLRPVDVEHLSSRIESACESRRLREAQQAIG
ncbi:MAG: response regulator [Phycisphaerae bacterium]|nr:response regulator [Phycisphaerae bacterium]